MLAAVVLLTMGFGGQFAYGQERDRVLMPEEWEALGDTPPGPEVWRAFLKAFGDRESRRAEPPRRTEMTVGGSIVAADRFELVSDIDVIEAVGNVIVTTAPEGGSTVTMRTERMTIEEIR